MRHDYQPLIYIVDDDEDDRYLLQTLLYQQFGVESVRAFEEGSSLLTQLTHRLDGRLPDLIILDLQMPILHGTELLQIVKQTPDYQHIPVVVMSAIQHGRQVERCYELGTSLFITKMTSPHEVAASLKQLGPLNQSAGAPARRATCHASLLKSVNTWLN